jgi:hypothetical protein
MVIELDYVTVIYECGCAGARPVQRPRTSDLIYSNRLCKHCQQEEDIRDERRATTIVDPGHDSGDHYMVDGKKWHIYQSGGYWYGRRYEHKQYSKRYFGKDDPRPGLQVAL